MASSSNKPWFGPKRIGWGFRPATWQGWLVTAAYVGALLLTIRLGRSSAVFVVLLILESAAFLIVALLTSRKRG